MEREMPHPEQPNSNPGQRIKREADFRLPLFRKELPQDPPVTDSTLSVRELFQQYPEEAQRLLRESYKSYELAFPYEDEREPLHSMQERLQDPQSNWDILFVLRGGEIVGARHFDILETQIGKVCSGEYIWVVPGERRMGIGSEICRASEEYMKRKGVKLIISEQNDPHVMSQNERESDLSSGISPEGRIAFWAQQGYMSLDAPYIQPPLSPDTSEVLCLKVSLFPLSSEIGQEISRDVYLNILEAYFRTWPKNVNTTPTFHKINVATEGSSSFAIIPIQQPRSYGRIE